MKYVEGSREHTLAIIWTLHMHLGSLAFPNYSPLMIASSRVVVVFWGQSRICCLTKSCHIHYITATKFCSQNCIFARWAFDECNMMMFQWCRISRTSQQNGVYTTVFAAIHSAYANTTARSGHVSFFCPAEEKKRRRFNKLHFKRKLPEIQAYKHQRRETGLEQRSNTKRRNLQHII